MIRDIHSIFPFSSTIALLVFKLYIFLDQFSIVENLTFAFFPTNISTLPACKFTTLYLGAEHPSIYDMLASSSATINVCSNCPAPAAFNL